MTSSTADAGTSANRHLGHLELDLWSQSEITLASLARLLQGAATEPGG